MQNKINKIEIIDTDCLTDTNKLKEIDHWLRVMNWGNGWHYDLDIIWALSNFEKLNLPHGSTVLDAGAGLGITQFILAARGYNIISLDFAPRNVPRLAKGIFDIEIKNDHLNGYHHDYINYIDYTKSVDRGLSIKIKEKAVGVISKPGLLLYYLKRLIGKHFNIYYHYERSKNHERFGKITFVRGTFNNIPLADNTADALISISAYEHNKYEDMAGSVSEFERVLKPHCPMVVTTSAAGEKDWFFEPSMGWNFTYETLCKQFGIKHSNPFDFKTALNKLKMSKTLQSRIPPFYKYFGENGLPFGKLEDAQYIPVGIIKFKGEV